MVNLGSDTGIEEARWLETLPDHAIFSPLQSDASSRQCIAIRNTDLIVANGKSLRMTSLSEIKHGKGSSSSSTLINQAGTLTSSYKELICEVLDFDISEVILNPTGKLLAVIGSQRIAVVVLPRSGVCSSKIVGRHVAVKAAIVGNFYYHERIGGRARLASVKWHPWGQLGSSLLVMSKDGLLREFDVSSDVEEPIQTIPLLPSTSKSQTLSRSESYRRSLSRSRSRSQTPSMHRSIRSSSRFALDDDDDDDNSERTYVEETSRKYAGSGPAAVSFTLGIEQREIDDTDGASLTLPTMSWNLFTIFSICTNGDVFALCPFMPKTSILSLSLLRRLPSLAKSPAASEDLDIDLRARFISSLLKQVKYKRDQGYNSVSPSRSRRSISATPMSLDPRGSVPPEGDDFKDEEINQSFIVQAPDSTVLAQAALPQGPFLLCPAPIELREDRENISTDIFFAKCVSGEANIDLLGLLGDDGRVDICLLLDPIEPHWTMFSTRISSKGRRRVASSGRYALSDSDSEDEDVSLRKDGPRELPRLFVYETIDLGIPRSALVLQHQCTPQFILDPLYSDTVYIKHSMGAHAICFGRWTNGLLDAMNSKEAERGHLMERALHQTISSDVVRVLETGATTLAETSNDVIGLSIVSDIYLSYSFIALTSNGAVVALELGLRVEDDFSPEAQQQQQQQPQDTSEVMSGQLLYTSLLSDGPPFTPPEPFKMLNGLPYHPRAAIKGRQSREELRVSTESLRNLGNIVSTFRGEMRKIVQGGNAIQSRLDLQSNELQRQLRKLTEMRNRLSQEQRREEMIEKRIANIVTKQQGLTKRSDWLLQKLVENHSPEISVYEARWLRELERLEEEVGKMEKDKDESHGGLQGRVFKLEYQLELLRPSLLKAKEKKVKDSTTPQMGSSQLQAIEVLLAKEAQLLTTDRNIITNLQSKMQRQMAMY